MKKILFIYDYFLPAWKAGGPIRSIEQLINHLYQDYKFFIICSAYEHLEKKPMENVPLNTWTNINGRVEIFYNSSTKTDKAFILHQLRLIKPDLIFINGIYSYNYNIIPILASRNYLKECPSCKVILSPRGMLHPGALSQKKIKKLIYLRFLKLLNIPRKIEWHATDEQEAKYIRDVFGHVKISVAGNFPRLSAHVSSPIKEKGELIMGTLALVSPMKNHLEILKCLVNIKTSIIWHIYGPVKDSSYWKECLKQIESLPENIKVIYHGSIPPDQINQFLEQIQLFILPSKSENFGHAILEALSAGKPVITTDTTPFLSLKEKQAGITVSANNIQQELQEAIQYFTEMNQDTFTSFQEGAAEYAKSFSNIEKLKEQYQTLFEVNQKNNQIFEAEK